MGGVASGDGVGGSGWENLGGSDVVGGEGRHENWDMYVDCWAEGW